VKEARKTIKAHIFAVHAGCGKSTLAKKYKNVLDIESSPLVYDYEELFSRLNIAVRDEAHKRELYEQLKGRGERLPNPNFPANYISAIRENMDKYDYIFIWANPRLLDHLVTCPDIDYKIIAPKESCAEIYYKRFIDRGNSPEWAKRISGTFGEQLERLEKYNKATIMFDGDETLESYLTAREEYPRLVPKVN